VARIALGLQETISLGVLDSRRDWGFAGDYVEAMWLMLQQDAPDDYVVATGVSHSVQDVLDVAFAHIGIPDWSSRVVNDDRFRRPAEVDHLVGDASKARDVLGWKPQVTFEQLICDMVDADRRREGGQGD
jgi:GDPmannose 4,6-dehydratase